VRINPIVSAFLGPGLSIEQIALASCRGWPADVFVPEHESPAALALPLKICSICPVAGPCREAALAAPAWLKGVLGGLSSQQREVLRREAFRRKHGRRSMQPMAVLPLEALPEPTEAQLVAVEAEEEPGRDCAECQVAFVPRVPHQVTCSKECARARHDRQRHAKAEQVAKQRAAAGHNGASPAPSTPLGHNGADPLEGVTQWLRHLPASITGISLASGWRLERQKVS
jgi:Transcription factor WhiB